MGDFVTITRHLLRERSLIMTWGGRQIRGGVIIFWGIPIGGVTFF